LSVPSFPGQNVSKKYLKEEGRRRINRDSFIVLIIKNKDKESRHEF
jgi:hypothetical protein